MAHPTILRRTRTYTMLSAPRQPLPPTSVPGVIHSHGATDEWAYRYVSHGVMAKQYQLADDLISKVVIDSIQSGIARESASLLATVYFQRKRYGGTVRALGDVSIQSKLAQSLNVISLFLFDGGYGQWEEWLDLAVRQSQQILKAGRFMSLKDALINCDGSEQFIVKTTIWFDVLASVTRMRPPSLFEAVKELFDPNQSSVLEVSNEGNAPALSMMTVMGCEGRIIWALAQISALAQAKEAYAARGAVDTMWLVNKCKDIEALLHPPAANSLKNEEVHRVLTSEVFRNAARLYLYTIVHGDFPNVQPIRKAVDDTFAALQAARKQYSSSVGQIVVRSTVFAVFMLGYDEGIVYGNFKGVTEVMESVWNEREKSEAKDPVPWRKALFNAGLLLV
ncbi:hypothetical protein PQX77_005191 [Marasmius sp. AFHP31]|nr:hypothetical protein PQX77_005191 [Marasmius sp. AFHP31]